MVIACTLFGIHLGHDCDSSSKRDLQPRMCENGKNEFNRWYYVLFSFFCFSCSLLPCEGNKMFAER